MTVFVFIDESGDPGNILEEGASSPYYIELALQIKKDTFRCLAEHIVGWQYILGRFDEVRSLPKNAKQLKRYLDPLIGLCDTSDLCCSCVYLIKEKYHGPHLHADAHNPLKFRNFVHRKLLEHHFKCFPANGGIELIFDRYRMSKDEMDNLDAYLRNNWNLPQFGYISHINSAFSGVMQVTSQLANAAKDLILGPVDEDRKNLLSFIKLKNITEL